MKKTLRILALTGILTFASSFTAMAGWEQTGEQWKYKDDVAEIYLTGWQWIDGNGDGIAECYYLDSNGVMASSSSIDGSIVNEQGQWVVDGVVQTKVVLGGSSQSNSTSIDNGSSHQESNSESTSGGIRNSRPSGITIAETSEVEYDSTGYEAGSSEGLPAMH